MAKAEARYTIKAKDETATGLRSAQQRLARFGQFIASRVVIPVESLLRLFGFLPRRISQANREMAELADLARQLNASLEEAQSINVLAGRAGLDPGDVRDAVETIAERIKDAQDGSKDVQRNFARLGIDFNKLAQGGILEQLITVSDALQAIPEQSARAISSDLFGEGRGGLFQRDLRADIRRAGDLGLLKELGEAAEGAQRWRAALSETGDILSHRLALGADVAAAGLERLNEILADPSEALPGERNMSGSFTIGEHRVASQLERAARNLNNASQNLENRTARYSRR